MAVDLDDRAVDHGELEVGVVGDGAENPLENTGPDPVPEPLEGRVHSRLRSNQWRLALIPELRRQVPSRAAGPRHPQHRLQEKPRIASSPAGVRRLPKAMRLNPHPLRIRQDHSRHALLPFGSLNQNLRTVGILNLNTP